MKTKTFTFNYTTSDNKKGSIRLPENYQHNLNNMQYCQDYDNCCYTLCIFCEEYSELSKNKKRKFQAIIDSGIVDNKLKTFYDLRVLVSTIESFGIIKGVSDTEDLGLHYFAGEECDYDTEGKLIHQKLKGVFHDDGNYYFIVKQG